MSLKIATFYKVMEDKLMPKISLNFILNQLTLNLKKIYTMWFYHVILKLTVCNVLSFNF